MSSHIYTKTGDQGLTGLVGGKRVSKSHSRIALYGEVDTLNSWVGVLVVSLKEFSSTDAPFALLQKIQENLFNLGGRLACESSDWERFSLPSLDLSLTNDLERSIDSMEEDLPALRNFILPGGSRPSAHAHLCRTYAREVERDLVALIEVTPEEIPEGALIFLNRLSDYFFVLARWVNKKLNQSDIIWKGRS